MKRFLATPDLEVMVCDAVPGVDVAPNSRWISKSKAERNVGNNGKKCVETLPDNSRTVRLLVCPIFLRIHNAKCQAIQSIHLPAASAWTDFPKLLQISRIGAAICDPLGVVGAVHVLATEAPKALLRTFDGLAWLPHLRVVLSAVWIASFWVQVKASLHTAPVAWRLRNQNTNPNEWYQVRWCSQQMPVIFCTVWCVQISVPWNNLHTANRSGAVGGATHHPAPHHMGKEWQSLPSYLRFTQHRKPLHPNRNSCYQSHWFFSNVEGLSHESGSTTHLCWDGHEPNKSKQLMLTMPPALVMYGVFQLYRSLWAPTQLITAVKDFVGTASRDGTHLQSKRCSICKQHAATSLTFLIFACI